MKQDIMVVVSRSAFRLATLRDQVITAAKSIDAVNEADIQASLNWEIIKEEEIIKIVGEMKEQLNDIWKKENNVGIIYFLFMEWYAGKDGSLRKKAKDINRMLEHNKNELGVKEYILKYERFASVVNSSEYSGSC